MEGLEQIIPRLVAYGILLLVVAWFALRSQKKAESLVKVLKEAERKNKKSKKLKK